MKMEFTLLPFNFPNFIRVKELPTEGGLIDVGTFAPAEAEKYWDTMKSEWLAHIQRRRTSLNG